MDAQRERALEAAGWKFGDAADFLEMNDEERELLDAQFSVSKGQGAPAQGKAPKATAEKRRPGKVRHSRRLP